MHRLIIVLLFVIAATTQARAQWVVTDPGVTARSAVTAAVKEQILTTQRDQHSQLRRMAQRLSLHTDLRKYVVPDPPRWRIHDFVNGGTFLFAGPFHAALNYGDSTGDAYVALTHPWAAARDLRHDLTALARRALAARFATIDVTDAATIAAANDTGRVRYNGRRELTAIDVLESHVVDPSNEQSTAAVLDKISGATLIAARQRQARTQLLTDIVEQLLVDSKRARDTDAAAMNMQLTTWRDADAANRALVAGTADAIRNWRQP